MLVSGSNGSGCGAVARQDHTTSASFDGLVKLWDTASGRVLAILQGHTGGVWSVALSRDGDLVAGGSQDGTIKLWTFDRQRSSERGQVFTTLQGHTTQLFGVAHSGDGRRVVSGAQDGTVSVWDGASGNLLQTLRKHAGKVFGVAVSADGRVVASSSQDVTVTLWDAKSGQLMNTLVGHTGAVSSVALSSLTLTGHIGPVCGVALSADGRMAASVSEDGTVRLWSLEQATRDPLVRTLRAERRCERMDISGLTGITNAQRHSLMALGAVDRTMPSDGT